MEFTIKIGDELRRLIASHRGKAVILNLHEVELIDSCGLSLFLSLRAELEEKGKRIAICSPQRHIQKIMELVDFTAQFEIYENESHAIDALLEERILIA